VIRACATCLILLSLAAPAAAEPISEKVSSGAVTAELSYERKRHDYSGFHVKIDRQGQTLFDGALRSGCKDEPCGVVPANRAGGEDSIRLRDLDGDREPEVIVDLFTGGAHCCDVSTIYWFAEGSGKYAPLRHDWRDAGYRLQDLGRDGTVELRTRDARFAYRFSSYAESYMPVRFFRFRDGRLVDVSQSLRRWLRLDARRALRLYKRARHRDVNVRGILAAYAADRYRLGQRRGARATLFHALRRGDLSRRLGALDIGPFGRSYIARLDRFLKRIGYAAHARAG
jgi:hypothetical protein